MKKKCLTVILLFICNIIFAQINININLISKGKEYLYDITIKNNSDNPYLIPLDTKGLKMFFEEETCNNFDFNLLFPDLGLATILKEDNSIIEPDLKFGYMLDSKSLKNLKSKEQRENKLIKKWKKDNGIKSNSEAKINKYIYENLIFIKPRGKFIYRISFNPFYINYSEYKNSKAFFYPLEKNRSYNLSLELCVDKNIYNHLTEKQKSSFDKYIFFEGRVISGEVVLAF